MRYTLNQKQIVVTRDMSIIELKKGRVQNMRNKLLIVQGK